jgi:hypothetical protein
MKTDFEQEHAEGAERSGAGLTLLSLLPPVNAGAVCLTDAPVVVRLRREFFELDGRVEVLKIIRDSRFASAVKREAAVAELTSVNERKAEIAREISGAAVEEFNRRGAETK